MPRKKEYVETEDDGFDLGTLHQVLGEMLNDGAKSSCIVFVRTKASMKGVKVKEVKVVDET